MDDAKNSLTTTKGIYLHVTHCVKWGVITDTDLDSAPKQLYRCYRVPGIN